MPVDSVGIEAHILTLSQGDVLFRKPRKFELSSSNTFEFSKKYDRGVKFNPPPPPRPNRVKCLLGEREA